MHADRSKPAPPHSPARPQRPRISQVEAFDQTAPALIGFDWGSSNLRAALLDHDGNVIEKRESSVGVFAVKQNAFFEVIWQLCKDWIAEHRVPLLACGMIGSRQGMVEVPYVDCPAHAKQIANALHCVAIGPMAACPGLQGVRLHIAPGLRTGSQGIGWDVMRGEETQLIGIDAPPGGLIVLPGTHSKWISLDIDGRVGSFQTCMTGELFDLLSRHSTLARMMAPAVWSPDAFGHGVRQAQTDSLENLLFRVRTAGLMDQFPAHALPDYLSGLLIGAEVRSNVQAQSQAVWVLGARDLTRRYVIALNASGLVARVAPDDAVFTGLMRVARSAALVPPGPSPSCLAATSADITKEGPP